VDDARDELGGGDEAEGGAWEAARRRRRRERERGRAARCGQGRVLLLLPHQGYVADDVAHVDVAGGAVVAKGDGDAEEHAARDGLGGVREGEGGRGLGVGVGALWSFRAGRRRGVGRRGPRVKHAASKLDAACDERRPSPKLRGTRT